MLFYYWRAASHADVHPISLQHSQVQIVLQKEENLEAAWIELLDAATYFGIATFFSRLLSTWYTPGGLSTYYNFSDSSSTLGIFRHICHSTSSNLISSLISALSNFFPSIRRYSHNIEKNSNGPASGDCF